MVQLRVCSTSNFVGLVVDKQITVTSNAPVAGNRNNRVHRDSSSLYVSLHGNGNVFDLRPMLVILNNEVIGGKRIEVGYVGLSDTGEPQRWGEK